MQPLEQRQCWAAIIALFFVAAFGSSLDVAAIQAESPEPLDFNHELQTVGERTVLYDSKTWFCASMRFFIAMSVVAGHIFQS